MADTIDDLQAAEDHIGCLHHAARKVINAWQAGDDQLDDLLGNLDALTAVEWCRPSCQDGDCDEDCGCCAHEDGEPHHEEEDDA